MIDWMPVLAVVIATTCGYVAAIMRRPYTPPLHGLVSFGRFTCRDCRHDIAAAWTIAIEPKTFPPTATVTATIDTCPCTRTGAPHARQT